MVKLPNADLYMEVGDYAYPFQVQLPSNLPTSFEDRIGHSRFEIDAIIDIPW